MTVTLITNYHWRSPLYWWELTSAQQVWVQREHDWLSSSDTSSFEEETYIPFKGWIHTLSEFMWIGKNMPEWMQEWHGYTNDTYFSGLVIRYDDDNEFVQIATFIA